MKLRSIYDNRLSGRQFYLSIVPGAGNPKFEHESAYNNHLTFSDAGFQLLGLFRFWNIIEYWSPYRDVIGEDWDEVLTRFIPRIALARTERAYDLEGFFTFTVDLRPDPNMANPGARPDMFELMRTALQEQLGLRLEGQKVSSELLVVDHVERPDAN